MQQRTLVEGEITAPKQLAETFGRLQSQSMNLPWN